MVLRMQAGVASTASRFGLRTRTCWRSFGVSFSVALHRDGDVVRRTSWSHVPRDAEALPAGPVSSVLEKLRRLEERCDSVRSGVDHEVRLTKHYK